MFIIELRDSGVVNVTRDSVSLETSQRKSRLRSKPRTYMDSYKRTPYLHAIPMRISGIGLDLTFSVRPAVSLHVLINVFPDCF